MKTLGFVGLGAMGGRMASMLVERGYRVVGFDPSSEALAAAVEHGVEPCRSPRDVGDLAAVVLASLPDPDVVRAVALGELGLVQGGAMRTFVDLSTTGAAVAEEVGGVFGSVGVAYVDAPVTGGVAGLERQRLTVIVAGPAEAVAGVAEILATFGSLHVVGEQPGQAQLTKLLNNLLSATAVAVTSEALVLGARAGLDPEQLLHVFNAGSGKNTATSAKFPDHVMTRRFASGFRLRLMAKDVELCLAEARDRHISMPVGGAVQQLWTLAASCVPAEADHTELLRLYEEWTGVTLASTKEIA